MSTSALFQPLTLPNGAVLRNRIAKAAMEENLANTDHAPDERLCRLYGRWSEGGAGLLLTGNVMVDGRAMTGPGGVVVESLKHFTALRRWAEAGRSNGTHFWMQINHPGRQMRASLRQRTIAPSPIPMRLGKFSKMFDVPQEMTEHDIEDVFARYVETAMIAEEAGFTGVQIHAAHGYLLSQFLSPLTNQRTDRWGGTLHNRARLLLDILREIRSRVSQNFCLAVKINSADFQRGGFEMTDAVQVVRWLNEVNVDLVEISGGSYEAPAMQGGNTAEGKLEREAYFLKFAKEIRSIAAMPVMLTGGIKRKIIAEQVIGEGISVVGMATALAMQPDLPNLWREGNAIDVVAPRVNWRSKPLASLATRSLVDAQIQRLSRGKKPTRCALPALALLQAQRRTARRTKQYIVWAGNQKQKGIAQ
jgi:2,4-dienoyl-CoA reductase-like NADH-dependent reductase (Old Yellow Enzyme family)